jgi:hypothetical protein
MVVLASAEFSLFLRCAQPKKVYVVARHVVHIRGIRTIHGTVRRFPGNVETRNYVGGVSMCTVMEVKTRR